MAIVGTYHAFNTTKNVIDCSRTCNIVLLECASLFDMGGEYYCYASDITVCFPVSGAFSSAQRFVYETVLAANRAVLHAAKPGVAWLDMHLLAERTILTQLKERGCLRGFC